MGEYIGIYIGVTKGDTRSLDYGSYPPHTGPNSTFIHSSRVTIEGYGV